MPTHTPAEIAKRQASNTHNSHDAQAPAPGLEALLFALQGGGEPQGNIADLPPVVPGAIPGAQNMTLQGMLAQLTPEMLALLGPIGQEAAVRTEQNQGV